VSSSLLIAPMATVFPSPDKETENPESSPAYSPMIESVGDRVGLDEGEPVGLLVGDELGLLLGLADGEVDGD
jgi:hypothetical protein